MHFSTHFYSASGAAVAVPPDSSSSSNRRYGGSSSCSYIFPLCIRESFVSRTVEFIVGMSALVTFVTHLTLSYVWVDELENVSVNVAGYKELGYFWGGLTVFILL